MSGWISYSLFWCFHGAHNVELSSQILWDVFEFCSVGAECTGGRRYGGINCQGEEETRQLRDRWQIREKQETHPRDKNEETVATATLISSLSFNHMQTFALTPKMMRNSLNKGEIKSLLTVITMILMEDTTQIFSVNWLNDGNFQF